MRNRRRFSSWCSVIAIATAVMLTPGYGRSDESDNLPNDPPSDPVEEILFSKSVEFAVTQERLFEDFLTFTFNEYCSAEFDVAMKNITNRVGPVSTSPTPMEEFVALLLDRDDDFLQTFEDCQNLPQVLALSDQFILRVPEIFARETLLMAELVLRDPTRDEPLEQRSAEVDRLIGLTVAKSYTPEKLWARFHREAP